MDHLNRQIQESLTGIRAVKAFVRGDFEEAQFQQVSQELTDASRTTFQNAVLNLPAFQLTMYAATVLLLNRWKGRWPALVLAGGISFSRMYLYLHFPTDVLGGLVTGALCGCLAAAIFQKWISPHWPENRPTTKGQKKRTAT